MVARLGFALSTALDPDVLLMDEAIGAGDARFAERAGKQMRDLLGRSSIVVLASHVTAQATCGAQRQQDQQVVRRGSARRHQQRVGGIQVPAL